MALVSAKLLLLLFAIALFASPCESKKRKNLFGNAKTVIDLAKKLTPAELKKLQEAAKMIKDKDKGSNGGKKKLTKEKAELMAEKIAAKVGTKLASKLASMLVGGPAGVVISGVSFGLGLLGDFLQKDKCKLECCPKHGTKGAWACKYQNKNTCIGSFSDYPGHGDHACHWNEQTQKCEVGRICRRNNFNFFMLFGSFCPPCPDSQPNSPALSLAELKARGLPKKFYIDPNDEKVWCAPKGVKNCNKVTVKADCQNSYAKHKGDQNCHWDDGTQKCSPGRSCHSAKGRIKGAQELGLTYNAGYWRKGNVILDPKP